MSFKLPFSTSEMLEVYRYDLNNRYIGNYFLTYKDRSTTSGRWLIPARCTVIEPPPYKEGKEIYFDKKNNKWIYK